MSDYKGKINWYLFRIFLTKKLRLSPDLSFNRSTHDDCGLNGSCVMGAVICAITLHSIMIILSYTSMLQDIFTHQDEENEELCEKSHIQSQFKVDSYGKLVRNILRIVVPVW